METVVNDKNKFLAIELLLWMGSISCAGVITIIIMLICVLANLK